jgi:MerR family mercuric resistance operon transcriptional regulator
MGKNLTIGQLARQASVNVETVRYYQRCGLITQPEKPPQGYRRYPEATLQRLRFIRKAQSLGFSLQEIAQLLTLEDNPCKQAMAIGTERLAAIDAKIGDLQKLQQALRTTLRDCQSNRNPEQCPLIASLTEIT